MCKNGGMGEGTQGDNSVHVPERSSYIGHQFKNMEIDDIMSIPYDLQTQKYVHKYAYKSGKVFRTKQFKKGILTITRKL